MAVVVTVPLLPSLQLLQLLQSASARDEVPGRADRQRPDGTFGIPGPSWSTRS
jgi:hypothetical protein